MPRYVHTSLPMEIVPQYSGLMKISSLLASAAFLDIRTGNPDRGLDFIEKDVGFYKRILAGKDTSLLCAMVAVKKIGEYTLGASKLIEAEALDLALDGDRLRRILEPFNPVESVANALEIENISTLQAFSGLLSSQAESGEPWKFGDKARGFYHKAFMSLLYKKNMTMNRMYSRSAERTRRIRAMEMRHLPSLMGKYREEMKDAGAEEVSFSDIPLLYKRNGVFFWKNYVGEVLLGIAVPDSMPYFARACDTAVFMRLVRLQLELAFWEGKPEDFSGSRVFSEILNPYTEAPFSMDSEKKVLWFVGARSTEKERMQVAIPAPFQGQGSPGKNGSDSRGFQSHRTE